MWWLCIFNNVSDAGNEMQSEAGGCWVGVSGIVVADGPHLVLPG